ncbi:MAG TPA: DUF6600 domain-containing protein [Verrucomicrobiae bacterium]|nr:DUF6600 domain-containing protein [Verrucomicrobiae bacterium]
MKIRFLSFLCAVVGLSSLAANKSVASNVSFSISVFDAPLGRCGSWVDRPGYGRCWHPAYVSSEWRPYCEGYWLWTDGGWYWVSDEQWAWATYHYGRWVEDSYYGWVWVPDTEWAPSWVSWREGDGYVGWAPLPPGAGFGPQGYVVVREEALPPRAFVFIEIGHFCEPIHRRAVVVNNVTIINKTLNITKITRVNNVVVNNGPKVETIQKVSSRKLTVPPPRVAVEHRGVEQPRETSPKTPKPPATEPSHQPANEEKARKHEPEIIRGGSNNPQQPSGAPSETEKKQPEKQPIESQPAEKPHGQPPPSEKPRVAPQPTEKQPPRGETRKEERKDEKQDRKDEKDKKGDQGGN